MNKFEYYACCQIFHSFPENKSFTEVLELCKNEELKEAFNDSLEDTENEDQQLTLCELYENEDWNNIPNLLEDLSDAAKRAFG